MPEPGHLARNGASDALYFLLDLLAFIRIYWHLLAFIGIYWFYWFYWREKQNGVGGGALGEAGR